MLNDSEIIFFFFKQKTAYEFKSGFVGSKMCKKDRFLVAPTLQNKKKKTKKNDACITSPSYTPGAYTHLTMPTKRKAKI